LNGGSKNTSPYSRNSSGSKKGTPTGSNTRPGGVSGAVSTYARPIRNISNSKT
jgi:hypothetical protein